MERMIFKNVCLIGGIILLSTLFLGQPSWSCDDGGQDGWKCGYPHKWDGHDQCQPPHIQGVYQDYKPDSEALIRFSIWGKNFDSGIPPVVTLGGLFDLTVREYTDDYIIAILPLSEEPGFQFGDYRLVVSTCHDAACKYCKDQWSRCKDKRCRDYYSKCKSKYCRDGEHKCRCKDRYSLTIAGPQGQAGPIVLKTVSAKGQPSISNELDLIGIADCGPGYKVTGGGYSCARCSKIIESKPLQEGTGWQVVGRALPELATDLDVYAVCVQIN